jgi:hypothetical protein
LHIGRVANQRGILVMGLEIVNFKEWRDWNIISKWIFQIYSGCSTTCSDNYVYAFESAVWFVHNIVI